MRASAAALFLLVSSLLCHLSLSVHLRGVQERPPSGHAGLLCTTSQPSGTRRITLKSPSLVMMGEPRQAPSYEDAFQTFLSWVDGVQSFEVIDPDTHLLRPFVVADDVRKYFEEDNHRKLQKLISLHFPDPGSLWVDDIIPDNVAVFCTLLSIEKGWWMKKFCHHRDLSDTALPFDPTRPPPSWPEQGADFLPQFCKAQWRFCAPVLRAPFVGKRFPKDMVLPIVFKQTLNTEGSSASLWLIKIHPSYNNLISEADKKKLGPLADTFVMKTYFTSEAERYYNTEVAAFRYLGSNPSIIKFHGSFARGDSYNVLLEYADKGTLADYFKNESPPSEGEEIILFWEAMFKLLDALRRIHEVGSDDLDGPRVFQGRHQDVKPENILVVSNGSKNRGVWVFKLADLGISNFKGRKPGRQDPAEKTARGTRTYGAPESYRPDGTYVHDTLREGQNSDIWSLGCIYSEAARWLKDGHRGIQAYRQERQGETSQIPGFRDGDCFHDGEKMLTCVRQCHRNSVRILRPEDFITRPVVEVLIEDMLGMAEARSTAYKLYQKSKQLVINAEGDLETARTEPEPSSPPKFHGRQRKRSFTAPNPDTRPPAPPNPPPGFPAIGLHVVQNTDVSASQYVPPRNILPPHIPDASDTTPELEGVENLRLSPTSPGRSPSPRELSHQRLQSPPTVIYDEPEDSKRVSAVVPETRYESPSPPRSQTSVPATSSLYHPPPTTTAEPPPPQSSPSNHHIATESVIRPKPLIIQGPPKLPTLSLEDALEWRRKRKGNGPKKQLKDSQYLDRLKDRDHVFLIDDSTSMSKHWGNVQNVFETVSYIVKEVDPDGFDLWFTGPGKPLKNCQKTTAPLQTVESRRLQGTTDINVKLTKIFDDYIEALQKPRTGLLAKLSKPVKPLSLYVLTDGVWEENCNPRDVVENFVRQLETLRKVKGKVGIQFISFGQDPVGLRRMQLLDSGLEVKLDIVDTEPWHGNVWKMLLGAINDSFDKIHDKHDTGENGASSSSNRMSIIPGHKEEYS